jgi:integrase
LAKVRFHDLRHTAITNFRRAGVLPFVAKDIVCHASEKMTAYYPQLRTAVDKTAAQPAL